MTYTPTEWQNGDVITAEKLNKLEEGVKDSAGYECTKEMKTAFDDTVETSIFWNGGMRSLELTFLNGFDFTAPTIDVIFNEIEYKNVELHDFYGSKYYGEPYQGGFGDFSNYPFCIIKDSNYGRVIVTKLSDTYNIKINYMKSIISTTESFEDAVKKSNPPLMYIIDGPNESIIEGHISNNSANGLYSHVEGSNITASGDMSHAEGTNTTASGDVSHAEGTDTTASGYGSHAEGADTIASGSDSHAQNYGTIAQGEHQTAIGQYNIAQGDAISHSVTDYAFIIGNGSGDNNRSNALAIKWNGTFVFANGTEISPAQFAQLLALLN